MPDLDVDIDVGDAGDGDANIVDHSLMVGADGNFTEDFSNNLPGFLDKETLTKEDGSPIKMFENTPSMKSLVKMAYDSKTALSKKMDNVIQKPGENATDEDIATYMGEIDAARGVPTEAQNYEFPLAEGETEETLYTPEHIEGYKKFAHDNHIPADVFGKFVLLNKQLAKQTEDHVKQQIADAETKVINELKEKNPGEGMVVAGKQVFNALSKFNKNNPAFLEKMKEAGVFENPSDMQRWKNAGVTPQNFQAWHGIAQELKISHSTDGSGSAGGGGSGDLSTLLPKSAASLGVKG